MPEAKDVTVGSTWRWVRRDPGSKLPADERMGVRFVIGTRFSTGRVEYTYDGTLGTGASNVQHLVNNAELVPTPAPAVCAPGCTPAEPCNGEVCPGRRENDIACSHWGRTQWGRPEGLYYPVPDRAHAAPELRCDRDMVCGLYRTT